MGILAFCANAAALSQGKWVAWPKCQGCARRLDGSDFTKAAGVVAPAAFLSDKVDTSLKTVAALTGGNLTQESMQKLYALAEG